MLKKKNVFKISLDLIMTIAFVLMFNKMVLGQQFHEIGGLAVILLLIVHAAINHKWILSVSKNMFSKKLKLETRIGYLLDIFLLIFIILIAVSGLIISKELPVNIPVSDLNFWKTIHIGISCFTLAIAGLHLGLHIDWICSTVKKMFKVNHTKPFLKWGMVFISIIIIGYGLLSFSNTNYIRNLSGVTAAFGVNLTQGPPRGGDMTLPKDASGQVLPPAGQMPSKPMGGVPEISVTNVLQTILSYISIMSVFAGISYIMNKFFAKKQALLSKGR